MTNFGRWIKNAIVESFFRNRRATMPYRDVMGLLLGFVTALLLLTSWTDSGGKLISESTAAWIFAVLVVLVLLLLVIVRPNEDSALDRFAWGVLVLVVLGFGAGALTFHYRDSFVWLWQQYLRIDTMAEVVLEVLFLLGVILGFFVVRNWGKEQKDFVDSLVAVVGGAFVAGILGKALEGQVPLINAFALYGLGFALSGTLNLIIAARLTSVYTNRGTIGSRALLDFLYGSERAKTIDGYFLKHFQESPDYAKEGLVRTLVEFAGFTKERFANRMEARRKERIAQRTKQLKQACKRLGEIDEQLAEAQANRANAAQGSPEAAQLDQEINRLNTARPEQEALCNLYRQGVQDQCANGQRYYQVLAIEGEVIVPNNPPADDADRRFTVLYRPVDEIRADMFRFGVSVRWQDTLEYIVAPGEYKGSFPLMGSVSGLALLVRQSVVMDRDRFKQFRSRDYPQGIAPEKVEQKRGLDEIDFLSYVSIPVVSRLGMVSENAVGILGVDTRLFLATDAELAEGRAERGAKIYSSTLSKRNLTSFASRLYEQNDPEIKYLEEVTKIIVPVLELYLRCRIGAT